jgi:WD40 repeat protein
LKGHGREVAAVAFTPDGQTLLAGADDIKLWDPASGQERGSFTKHTQPVKGITLAADGQRVASAGGDQVIFWRLADRQVIKDWRLPSPVLDLLFSPNGYLACACDNGAVYILRLP